MAARRSEFIDNQPTNQPPQSRDLLDRRTRIEESSGIGTGRPTDRPNRFHSPVLRVVKTSQFWGRKMLRATSGFSRDWDFEVRKRHLLFPVKCKAQRIISTLSIRFNCTYFALRPLPPQQGVARFVLLMRRRRQRKKERIMTAANFSFAFPSNR